MTRPFSRVLAAGLLIVISGCARHGHNAISLAPSNAGVFDTPETVVIGSSMKIGEAGKGPGPIATVEITRYQTSEPNRTEWVVRLFAGKTARLRPEEIPPLVKGISSLIEVPQQLNGFDKVVPRYITRSGFVTVSRSTQPGATVGGITQDWGLRYQVNDWYTNDVEELRKLKSLLQEAHDRLRAVE